MRFYCVDASLPGLLLLGRALGTSPVFIARFSLPRNFSDSVLARVACYSSIPALRPTVAPGAHAETSYNLPTAAYRPPKHPLTRSLRATADRAS